MGVKRERKTILPLEDASISSCVRLMVGRLNKARKLYLTFATMWKLLRLDLFSRHGLLLTLKSRTLLKN